MTVRVRTPGAPVARAGPEAPPGGGADIAVRGLRWRPSGRREPVLDGLDLHVAAGEKVLLAGPSGAGKSTLLRAVAGLLETADVGELSGEVDIGGLPPGAQPGAVGMLLQDPSAAVVAARVGRDVAFGLENVGVPREQMPARVRAALEAATFPYDEQRHTDTLSGGETQRLALAGTLAMLPRVLLLDEPTSMLDPVAAEQVRRSVLSACEREGTTLVVVEHHLEPWIGHVDRCVVLDTRGQVVADGPPERVFAEQGRALADGGIWVPGLPVPTPLQVEPDLVLPSSDLDGSGPLVRADAVSVDYSPPFGRRRPAGERSLALDGVSADLRRGEVLVLRGQSGAGKSTLMGVLAGLQAPDTGAALIHPRLAGRRGRALHRLTSRELAARLAWVPQLPEHGLVRRTVLDELLATTGALDRDVLAAEKRALRLLELLGLAHLAPASVHHLSGGEQRRLVVAAALVHGPSGLLLDEPTVGQDRHTWAAVAGLCAAAGEAGAAVAVATHDAHLTSVLSRRGQVLTLDAGRAA
ncbi:MAG TPA: ATP-binding cassette domain-containing protein [Nocardioidaceae bacterium]|nr:ATP-binding cassette domain-containing protein [Nocardioidaceae bacterium]